MRAHVVERDRRSPTWCRSSFGRWVIAGVAVAHSDNSARDLSPCQRREFAREEAAFQAEYLSWNGTEAGRTC
jgi:hypothetical protein